MIGGKDKRFSNPIFTALVTPYIIRVKPKPYIITDKKSIFTGYFSLIFFNSTLPIMNNIIAITERMLNIALQSKKSTINPLNVGPNAGPAPTTKPI